MGSTKGKIGSVTGASLERKTGKGKLTNSKRFDHPSETSTPTSADNSSVASQSGGRSLSRSTGNSSSRSFDSGNHQEALGQGISFSSKFGIQDIEVGALLGSDPYQADSNAPELSATEASQRKLKIQRQNNALDVRLEKVKQGRKVMAIATEQRRLIGDVVTYETAGVEVATKVVQHEIAGTKFNIEQSKLVQTQELLTQQEITTQGTINLTQGIAEEWEIRYERQQAKNAGLRLEVEGALGEIEGKRRELEARLLLIGGG